MSSKDEAEELYKMFETKLFNIIDNDIIDNIFKRTYSMLTDDYYNLDFRNKIIEVKHKETMLLEVHPKNRFSNPCYITLKEYVFKDIEIKENYLDIVIELQKILIKLI